MALSHDVGGPVVCEFLFFEPADQKLAVGSRQREGETVSGVQWDVIIVAIMALIMTIVLMLVAFPIASIVSRLHWSVDCTHVPSVRLALESG